MQSQMIGMQSSLDRILSAVQPQIQTASQPQPYSTCSPRRDGAGYPIPISNSRNAESFPPLPGFAPPVNLYSILKVIMLTIY